MKKAYYIYFLHHAGNVGPDEISPIEEQPKDGFTTEKDAEIALEKLFKDKNNDNKWPFYKDWNSKFVILPTYQRK